MERNNFLNFSNANSTSSYRTPRNREAYFDPIMNEQKLQL